MKLLLAVFGLCAIAFGQTTNNLSVTGPLTLQRGKSADYKLVFRQDSASPVAALQWKLQIAGASVSVPVPSAQAVAAGKTTIQCNSLGSCTLIGMNTNTISSGEIATFTISVPTASTATSISVQVSAPLVSADPTASAVPLIAAAPLVITTPVFITDLTGDGRTDIADVIVCLGQALSFAMGGACTIGDVNGDGKCDILDAQVIVINRTP